MFRLLEISNILPYQWPVDLGATFDSGSAAMLSVNGGSIVVTPSNGTAFIGIFDDVKKNSHFAVAWDEEVIVLVPSINISLGPNNTLISNADIKAELQNPNIDINSFVSTIIPVQLIPRNGVIIFPAGTPLNFDLLGTGFPNAYKTLVRYRYQVPNIIGDDSTRASGMATVWYSRLLAELDQFETNQQYQLNSNLFVNETGLFTTRQISPNSPAVAICTAPPTSIHGGSLQLLLL